MQKSLVVLVMAKNTISKHVAEKEQLSANIEKPR